MNASGHNLTTESKQEKTVVSTLATTKIKKDAVAQVLIGRRQLPRLRLEDLIQR